MPTPAYYCQCDACPARVTYTARRAGREIRLCYHHGKHHMGALIAAGFIVSAAKVPA
jgi:hypothetical protein